MSFEAAIQRASGALVLDGGLATELERRGHPVSGGLWSARVLMDRPDAVEQLHFDYFAAGAQCVISASYQASYEGYAALGLDRRETTALLRRSVLLAVAGRGRYERTWRDGYPPSGTPGARLFVAASVGAYGATRADGSEYHGNYGLSVSELRSFHEDRLAVLATAGADVLACETIPSLDEAKALIDLLRSHSATQAWLSFTSEDGVHTAHGEPLIECARAIDQVENFVAVGVNCVHPRVVGTAIRQLSSGTGKPIVVYPNSGEQWDAEARLWVGAPAGQSLADFAPAWIEAGARVIGGCCRTGPGDVAALVAAVRR